MENAGVLERTSEEVVKLDWPPVFHEWTEESLSTHKVISDDACYKVHESHPVVQLLTFNEDLLGIRMAAVPRDSGGYLKIRKVVFESSVDLLKEYTNFPASGC